ncbi:p-nitrophenyl phosphatase [Ophidiomyces ophidiicola]|uniref:p-nitrophenyl phosphatase n=1 Tax=Ophidiomyces ophidiicola TaxID=1387563 RepID=UPI0020C259F8|nr:p-nitrophenyl phosphatase [Ophidiomyces ophidiicola]KAI1913135.1 p-nitrophenyl phosphatase [Ophidiomyces ophidiicola]KAI1920694.1 p-nitrophenyl phosphatase [Ophidiomyces ophidiicola]KAI1928547.1 p-nitrophenyl phosphatase [Ophidiomyces ophidiicola]KAI1946167.1 p-nitrophenyl phosphatase [Ophidiomyces ophidiicola]KAI1961261.1 p-nitrophenyl phosphatase [Ophidiomyces ophidiicola]
MKTSPRYLTGNSQEIKDFIDQFDVFLFDCDGVLWSGDIVFEGTVATLEMLRKKGKQIVFVTNNSTKSRLDYQKKLEKLGIPAAHPVKEEVFSSSYSASVYIARILNLPPNKRKVFLVGETGAEQELQAENIPFIGGTDPSYRRNVTSDDYHKIASGDSSLLDPEVGVVLVGLDFHINYLKISLAYHYIRRGAIFLATNIDSTLPSAGTLFPGAGTISAPLIRMLGGTEPISLGKPSPEMMEAIEGKFKFDRRRACMVGDRLDTDIRFGIEGGLGGTLGVLSGVSSKADFETAALPPSVYVDTLGDLLDGV